MQTEEFQQVLETVSENQLNGLRTLQQDTNKYLDHLTKIISDITKSITKGVPKPIPFSGHPDEDINVWLEHFNAISSLNKWSQDDCANLLHVFLRGLHYTTFRVSMWKFVTIFTQQLLL